MAEVVLFHHAQGLTPGVVAFGDELRAAHHVVHTPDLYEGRIFSNIDDGVMYARTTGFDVIIERGRAAVAPLGDALVYAGFSLGVLCAQTLAQTRPGARGALLFHGCFPVTTVSEHWPHDVPVQVHAMEHDPWMEEDASAARELAATVPSAECFVYPGDRHLFADSSLPDYDEQAARLLMQRVLLFLDQID